MFLRLFVVVAAFTLNVCGENDLKRKHDDFTDLMVRQGRLEMIDISIRLGQADREEAGLNFGRSFLFVLEFRVRRSICS